MIFLFLNNWLASYFFKIFDLKNSDCNDKKWNYKNVIFKNSKKKE